MEIIQVNIRIANSGLYSAPRVELPHCAPIYRVIIHEQLPVKKPDYRLTCRRTSTPSIALERSKLRVGN